jgi:plastocyanin
MTPTPINTTNVTQTVMQIPTIEPTTEIKHKATYTPQEYQIRIAQYSFLPVGSKEIKVGDTVRWRNFESSRISRVLVNEDGLWEVGQHLPYMRSVSYTFNETGVYTFYLDGRKSEKWFVVVKE